MLKFLKTKEVDSRKLCLEWFIIEEIGEAIVDPRILSRVEFSQEYSAIFIDLEEFEAFEPEEFEDFMPYYL